MGKIRSLRETPQERSCACGKSFVVRRRNSPLRHCSLGCRFWSKVDKGGGLNACWPWLAGTDGEGYGCFQKLEPRKLRTQAHRVAWELVHGAPGAMHVLHRCDNPPCCNPEHLFLGTNLDNAADRHAKGRDAAPIHARMRKSTKLNVELVAEIRALDGAMTQEQIGDRFGVKQTTVSQVLRRETWRDV